MTRKAYPAFANGFMRAPVWASLKFKNFRLKRDFEGRLFKISFELLFFVFAENMFH